MDNRKSLEQSHKNRKYDRQLRLWGDHGQKCLEASKICLINASAVGTEILKSLVLPGIGSFTIIDDKKVTEEDIGSNFFLDLNNLGASRAYVANQNLLELNHDVRGDYIDDSIDNLLANNSDFFNDFSVVIATNITQKTLKLLSTKLWEINIPLIYCKSIGFIGYLRIQVNEHTVIQTHPDNEIPDFRLDKPFPELEEYMSTIDLNSMDIKEHSHVPYLVILYKIVQEFQQVYKRFPKNYKDKQILQEMIRQNIRCDEDQNEFHEDNFQEAINAVNLCCQKTIIPDTLKAIFNDDQCNSISRQSKTFWIIAKALKEFVENEGDNYLPVKGSLPDMISDTKNYIRLQKVYHNKAINDQEIVQKYVSNILTDLDYHSDKVTEAEIRMYCRCASELRVIRGSSIASEYTMNLFPTNLMEKIEDVDSPMIYYIILKAMENFYAEYNTYPGEFENQIELDIIRLKSCVMKITSKWTFNFICKDDYIHEICRYGGSELYSVSSFIGGCAAQECIKLITNQYIPLNNSMIYDSIRNLTESFYI